jgi:nitroreductase
VWSHAGHVATSAATIALVTKVADDPADRDTTQYDLGQATANIALAAAGLGIGSGHTAVADQALAQRVLGFPDGYLLAYLIPLGYPADRPLRPINNPNRRPFDDVVHRERW